MALSVFCLGWNVTDRPRGTYRTYTSLVLSPEALFRYQIVSAVKARALSGQRIDAAVREVAAQTHLTPAGEPRAVSVRSVYRWLAEQRHDAPADPEPVPSARVISQTLPLALLDFLGEEKSKDRYASVPELLRSAHQRGVIGLLEIQRPDLLNGRGHRR